MPDVLNYPMYGPQVNAILDLARAARRVEKTFPATHAAEFIQHLDRPAQNWWWDLIDIILDYEDAQPRGNE